MIYNLKEISTENTSLFGAKASALGRLIQNNINVPEGYVLSNEAFSSYLNKFNYPQSMYLSHNDDIQDEIIKGGFPPDISDRLAEIYNELMAFGESSIAIRSSATCEDNINHSMAGVFESFIDIDSYDEFENSIKKCYASFFSDKALALMLRSNVRFYDAGMCVIIQKFIKGNISGVTFTSDTINMDENIAVVNAVKGLCSGFVDGIGKSSQYRLNKNSVQIMECNISQDGPEIDKKELLMLVDAADTIERMFGCCQDVEWTIQDNELYILQSRPITTFKYNDSGISWSINYEDADKTWSLSSPDPTSPLTEELLYLYNDGITKGMLESGKAGGIYTKIINGYAYTYIAPRDLEKRKVFREKLDCMNNKGENIFQDIVLPKLMQYKDELDLYVNKPLQVDEVIKFIKKALEFFQNAIYLHVLAVDGSMYLEDFKKYCTDIMADISENDFYDMVFQKSELAVEREIVLRLAEFVKSDDILISLFNDHPYNEILYARLIRYEPGRRLIEMINNYLKQYGLMGLKGQRQIISEVLQEKPWEVLDKIRALMDIRSGIYYDSLDKIFLNKSIIVETMINRLDENMREDFMHKLKTAEKSFLVNDNHCFYIDLTSQGYLRLALMRAGEILTDKKIIGKPEDIYFLKIDEIFTSLIDEIADLKIEERKKIHDKHKKLIPPEYLGKAPDNSNLVNNDTEQREILKGVSGLNKKVSGIVKVIKDSIKNNNIKDNCILVLQNGHGCYFLPAVNKIKGLIYDEGSPFDHPGILAREFEIPSIYKTKNATKVLRDGDLVELDGCKGEVRVIKRS